MKRLSLLCGLAMASAGVVAAEATVNVSALDAQGTATPIGTVRLTFLGEFTRFESFAAPGSY